MEAILEMATLVLCIFRCFKGLIDQKPPHSQQTMCRIEHLKPNTANVVRNYRAREQHLKAWARSKAKPCFPRQSIKHK